MRSAGILMWRRGEGGIEVLLGHFGGPYWARKDAGAWAIPKGLIEPGESAQAAARREFREELGVPAEGSLVPLCQIRQKGGKQVEAFAMEGDFDPATLASNSFKLEWPPKSGLFESFPELDRVAWFTEAEAQAKILPSQRPLLKCLKELLAKETES
jgi:predicted NUDIX family NTP pyrophosphohydrolase